MAPRIHPCLLHASQNNVAELTHCKMGDDDGGPNGPYGTSSSAREWKRIIRQVESTVRHRRLVHSVRQIAGDIATNARKGDQVIVTARVRPWYWNDKQGEKHCENEFIVTGFPGAIGAAVSSRTPSAPTLPTDETVALTG